MSGEYIPHRALPAGVTKPRPANLVALAGAEWSPVSEFRSEICGQRIFWRGAPWGHASRGQKTTDADLGSRPCW